MDGQTIDRHADVERRGFLTGAIFALTSLIGGTLAALVGRYLIGTPKNQDSGWADAGAVARLEPGSPQKVFFERIRVDGWTTRTEKAAAWIILDNQKQITAFSPLCTHLGCAYRWQRERRAFTCPCHGSVFSANGDVIAGPASRPLDRYAVKVEAGRLWLGPTPPASHS
ncbi:MAG: ubiquinol-cytochrome c reductase iron-sulfur subunit [Bryobacteraceae bacterium]